MYLKSFIHNDVENIAKKQINSKSLPKCNATKKAFVFIKLNENENNLRLNTNT